MQQNKKRIAKQVQKQEQKQKQQQQQQLMWHYFQRINLSSL